ncbi:hypothetical protein D9611_001348 [Ephemerocybe angulata]|uniref:Uncharacterized protein n=1 Tax=Ephemerocybe angulata TaxID=980116 RepID=A0A8H5FMF5_9AGAR|nr:hypothetical protein D9611_001348 [Tulosesus angulatus]
MYDDILGPILVAYGSGVFLFGVLTLQTLFYYRLLELAHTSVSFVIVYKCMISYSGGLRGFEQSQPFFSANGILAVLIAAVVQVCREF